MKKKLFSGVTLLFAAAASIAIYNAAQSPTNRLTPAQLKNLEAVSQGESSTRYNLCYSRSKVKIGRTYYDCATCAKVYDEEPIGSVTKCFY